MDPRPPLDALPPPEMARRAEDVGVAKAGMPTARLLALAVLAGAFISLACCFSTTVAAGASPSLPWGVARLVMAVPFCLGLVLVVVGGAELFTGNHLLVMAWTSRRIGTRALLRNWVLVLVGNAAGALGTAALVLLARQHEMGGGAVGRAALSTAAAKCALDPVAAFALGILCNVLVCLAVWLTMSARTTSDRILAVLFPVTAFVACGFEHSIANCYLIPYALALAEVDPGLAAAAGVDLAPLDIGGFLVRNLLPVTLGNVVGGGVLVAAVYAMVYRRGPRGA